MSASTICERLHLKAQICEYPHPTVRLMWIVPSFFWYNSRFPFIFVPLNTLGLCRCKPPKNRPKVCPVTSDWSNQRKMQRYYLAGGVSGKGPFTACLPSPSPLLSLSLPPVSPPPPLPPLFFFFSLKQASPVPELWEPHKARARGPNNLRDRLKECLRAYRIIHPHTYYLYNFGQVTQPLCSLNCKIRTVSSAWD